MDSVGTELSRHSSPTCASQAERPLAQEEGESWRIMLNSSALAISGMRGCASFWFYLKSDFENFLSNLTEVNTFVRGLFAVRAVVKIAIAFGQVFIAVLNHNKVDLEADR